MTHDNQSIKQQLALGEDSFWEFTRIVFSGDQPVGPHPDKLGDTIVAFANAHGGVLLCGVTDAGEIQGMSRDQATALASLLVQISVGAIRPAVKIVTSERVIDGKRLLAVTIPKGYAQHDGPGGSYIRVGASRRRMTSDERLLLAQRRGWTRFDWPDEQVVLDTGLDTLDKSLWTPLLGTEDRHDAIAALQKAGLVARDVYGELRATVAGILFACPTPEDWLPGACIVATRYRGTDRTSERLDAQTITGPLNRQIAKAVEFAARNMRVGRRAEGRERPQYSVQALFEAVTNAVVHRDYSMKQSRIHLSMFSERIEIKSPGSLVGSVTVEHLEHQQATRNAVISSIFAKMPTTGIEGADARPVVVERRGDGIAIILQRTHELAGRAPSFEVIDGTELLVTLPAPPSRPTFPPC